MVRLHDTWMYIGYLEWVDDAQQTVAEGRGTHILYLDSIHLSISSSRLCQLPGILSCRGTSIEPPAPQDASRLHARAPPVSCLFIPSELSTTVVVVSVGGGRDVRPDAEVLLQHAMHPRSTFISVAPLLVPDMPKLNCAFERKLFPTGRDRILVPSEVAGLASRLPVALVGEGDPLRFRSLYRRRGGGGACVPAVCGRALTALRFCSCSWRRHSMRAAREFLADCAMRCLACFLYTSMWPYTFQLTHRLKGRVVE